MRTTMLLTKIGPSAAPELESMPPIKSIVRGRLTYSRGLATVERGLKSKTGIRDQTSVMRRSETCACGRNGGLALFTRDKISSSRVDDGLILDLTALPTAVRPTTTANTALGS